MPAKIIWTPEMVQAVTLLREDGHCVYAIADRIGVNVRTLRNWRRETGYKLDRLSPSRNGWNLGVWKDATQKTITDSA